MIPDVHPDAKDILERLRKEGITALYHFTSVENLPSLCRVQSLCSKEVLETRKLWPPPVPGGQGPSFNLDRLMGNWNKISLSLTPYTPMLFYRKKETHLCFLLVKPEVAAWAGVTFTDTNAAKTGDALRGEGYIGLNNIRFDIIRNTPRPWDKNWKRYVQAEVLVPYEIPLTYISQIVFISKASLMYAENLCHLLAHPSFSISPKLFADFKQYQWSLDIPHVINLIVTDTKIDENVVQLPHEHKNIYSKSISSQITAVAFVQGYPGIKGELHWMPTKFRDVIDFESSDKFYHWNHISLNQLPEGLCSVEYYLNGQHWASTHFEVVA